MMKLVIRKAVVLGAGTMGGAIAAHLAGCGIQVTLLDMPLSGDNPRNGLAQNALKRIRDPKNRLLFTPAAAELIAVGNIEDDLGAVAEADWVIEAIVEKLEPKAALFAKVGSLVKPGCVLSSNTSGISVTAISRALPEHCRPRFLGTHFFNPPRYMRLLELIPAESTDPALVGALAEFGDRRLGKTIVVAKDTPNFIANRIGVANAQLILWGLEQFDLSVASMDFLVGRLIGRPRAGYLRTCDLVGLDVAKATIDTNFAAESIPWEKELMRVPEYFREMLDAGMLGDKTRKGFYTKENGRSMMWDRKLKAYVPKEHTPPRALESLDRKAPMKEKILALLDSGTPEGDFLWYLLNGLFSYSANRIPEIADDFRKIDLGMQLGYNWDLGPFQLWDALGAADFAARMEADGVTLPEWVKTRLAANGGSFYDESGFSSLLPQRMHITDPGLPVVWETDEVVLKDLGDGIGAVVLVTPNSTIGDKAATSMIRAVKKAEELFAGAVIISAGKNFCVGSDLNKILDLCPDGQWDVLARNTDQFQEMNQSIKFASIPVVAAPFQNALGGGCEICLHAHKVVAFSELFIGLVEPQVGLIPAGGGLKELALRVMEPHGVYPELFTMPILEHGASLVNMCTLSTSAEHARSLGLLRPADRVVTKMENLLEAAKEEALVLSRSFIPRVPGKTAVFGRTGFAALQAKTNNLKAGGFFSEHDALIAEQVAFVLTGGDVPNGTVLDEAALLRLENERFVWICKQEKTQERMRGLLETGKPVRN